MENYLFSTLSAPTKKLLYECSCGEKILIIPDMPAMIKAIKDHLKIHKKITKKHLSEEALTIRILLTICELHYQNA